MVGYFFSPTTLDVERKAEVVRGSRRAVPGGNTRFLSLSRLSLSLHIMRSVGSGCGLRVWGERVVAVSAGSWREGLGLRVFGNSLWVSGLLLSTTDDVW